MELFTYEKPESRLIGIRDFARLPEVGVAHKNIIQAIDAGKITAVESTPRGRKLRLPEALNQWLATHDPTRQGKAAPKITIDGESIDLLTERARLTRAQRIKTELEVEALQGNLLYLDDVEAIWTNNTTTARARVAAMGVRIAAELAPLTNVPAPEIEAIVNALTREAQAELSAFSYPAYVEHANAHSRTVIPQSDAPA
jgi:hypothetical protein